MNKNTHPRVGAALICLGALGIDSSSRGTSATVTEVTVVGPSSSTNERRS